jgi:protein phosphatase
MNAWGTTDKGMARSQNQDSFFLDVFHADGQAICVVCDGMGGARAGNVASELAVRAFVEEVRGNLRQAMNVRQMQAALETAVITANRLVFAKSQQEPDFYGMGTTLVGAILTGNTCVVSNVGDSRAYVCNEYGIVQMTRDHSVVEDLLDRGDLTRDQARSHPSRNLITRALGTEASIDCDFFSAELSEGDHLLLCSDGLTNVVDDDEILRVILDGDKPQSVCKKLLALANERGGPDNITVVLVSF